MELLPEREVDEPLHIVAGLALADTTGKGFTVTVVVTAGLVCVPTVIVMEYTPALSVVTLGIVGFISEDVKPFGPVHE
jgi:hypothetical protein